MRKQEVKGKKYRRKHTFLKKWKWSQVKKLNEKLHVAGKLKLGYGTVDFAVVEVVPVKQKITTMGGIR